MSTATTSNSTAPAASVPALGDHQYGIYLSGLAGVLPELPVDPLQLEAAANRVLTPEAVGYVSGGAGSEQTMAANRAAFDRHRIVPRMLREVTSRDLRTTLFGETFPAPVLLAPVGVLSIVHPDGELAVARAAKAVGVPMIASTAASYPQEEIAAEAGPRWYQLYWPSDRELALSFVRRAEANGYTAVVVTLDTWTLGWRPRDLQQAYLPFLRSIGIANYLTDPVFRASLATSPEEDPQAAVLRWVQVFANPALSYADLAWLRQQTDLPILAKGVCHPDDARLALDASVSAVVVSNHGGRQVDGAAAALDCLPAVVDAVGGRVPVLFDSGVRTGADAVKVLALGATAVLLGRPYVWGLALGGQAGVEHVLRCLLGDLDLSLALAGYRSPSELTPGSLS